MLGFGVLLHIAQIFGAFWRLVGPFLGHVVQLKGTRGLLDTVKSSGTWGVAAVSLRLGVSPGFGGYFGRKMAIFGPKLRRFGRAPPDLAPPPRAAIGKFLAQNLDLAKPRFVAWPLELRLGTCIPRFVAWPLELGLGTRNPCFVPLPLELGLETRM